MEEDKFVWVSSKYVEALEKVPSVKTITFWSMLWLVIFVAIVVSAYFCGR
jgi:hypothetical protein